MQEFSSKTPSVIQCSNIDGIGIERFETFMSLRSSSPILCNANGIVLHSRSGKNVGPQAYGILVLLHLHGLGSTVKFF